MYAQSTLFPLAAGSLGLQVPGTGSTQIGSKFFAGMMIINYTVRFVSIKPSSIARNPPIPS
jgi:hypothetical protein